MPSGKKQRKNRGGKEKNVQLLAAALPAAVAAVAAAEVAADVGRLLAVAPAGVVGAELPVTDVWALPAAGSGGIGRKEGDVVVLRAGQAEKNGLRPGQPATVTKVDSFGNHQLQEYHLQRNADGKQLNRFGKEDLATPAPAGGRLLHVAALLGKPAAVVGALLAADPSAAGVADGLGRLPLHLAVAAGCSGETLALLHAAHPAAELEIKLVAEYIGQTAKTAVDAGALLAATPAGAAGWELPATAWYAGPAAGLEGLTPWCGPSGELRYGLGPGDVVVLRAGLAETNGLRPGQPATVTGVHWKHGDIELRRNADGKQLDGSVDVTRVSNTLVTPAPPGGLLLHLAAFLGKPAAVVGALLAAHPAGAGAADSLGRLPLEMAILAGCCSGEAWLVLWEGTAEDVRLGWAATYLGLEDVSDQQALAKAMTANTEWGVNPMFLAMFRMLVPKPVHGLISLPAAAKAVAAAETDADVEAVLAAAPAGAAAEELPASVFATPAAASFGSSASSFGILRHPFGQSAYHGSDQLDTRGRLLHVAALLGRPAAVVGALLAADPAAAAVADGLGRLPLELAILGGSSSGEAWELLWVATPEDVRLSWAAKYLGGGSDAVDLADQEALATLMLQNMELQHNEAALALFRTLLDGQRYELITKHLPAAAKAVAAAEAAADVGALLAAAPAGVAEAELPASVYAFPATGSEGRARKGGRLLHLAALLGKPAAVLGALLAADPSVAGLADGLGRLPLELLLSGSPLPSDEAVLSVACAEPLAVGADGRRALHLVLDHSRNEAVVHKVLAAATSVLVVSDRHGRQPWQVAAQQSLVMPEILPTVQLREHIRKVLDSDRLAEVGSLHLRAAELFEEHAGWRTRQGHELRAACLTNEEEQVRELLAADADCLATDAEGQRVFEASARHDSGGACTVAVGLHALAIEPAAAALPADVDTAGLWETVMAAVVAGPDGDAAALIDLLAKARGDLDFQHSERYERPMWSGYDQRGYFGNNTNIFEHQCLDDLDPAMKAGEDTNGDSLLHAAARHGRAGCVSRLLHHGACTKSWSGTMFVKVGWDGSYDSNRSETHYTPSCTEDARAVQTALQLAQEGGHAGCVTLLAPATPAGQGEDLTERWVRTGEVGSSGRTAAHEMSGQDNGELESELEATVLSSAVAPSRPFEPLLKVLLATGADPERLLLACADLSLLSPAMILVEEHGAKGTKPVHGEGGRIARDVGGASASQDVAKFFRRLGAYLGRFQLIGGPPVHRSKTCEAHFAVDLETNKLVCLKLMRNRRQFEAEIAGRMVNGVAIAANVVVEVIGWHMPAGESLTDGSGKAQKPETPPCADHPEFDPFPYVLVMPQGDRSLFDACSKERIAGVRVPKIKQIMCGVLGCLLRLHAAGLIHGDLKQRNVIRMGQQLLLIDMDACARAGMPIGEKTSSAYAPPELMRARLTGKVLDAAELSFDVFSFGVLLFEMCAGRNLFAQDTANDELVDETDKCRLCTWHVISDEELAPVLGSQDEVDFGGDDAAQTVADAKNLIRWCLQSDAARRPTVAEILGHRFFDSAGPAPALQPMQFFAFLSHAQVDASGTVADLYHALGLLGLHCWIDMRQELLTLEGMRQGVRDSRVLIFVLSENVLASWFCLQELLCAIEEGKPIQLVLEAEARFHPFDTAVWENSKARLLSGGGGARQILVRNSQGDLEAKDVMVGRDDANEWQSRWSDEQLAVMVYDAIDKNLPQAVTYRRRDYEQAAMIRELCLRNGVVLPSVAMAATAVVPGASGGIVIKVFVICNEQSAGQMFADLAVALPAQSSGRLHLTTDPADLDSADKVLLLLSKDVLSPPSLGQLDQALRVDRERQLDRICPVFSEAAGWRFNCPEQNAASPVVQDCLKAHEALSYRPQDAAGPSRHEFPALVDRLCGKLLLGSGGADGGVSGCPNAATVATVTVTGAGAVASAAAEPEPEPEQTWMQGQDQDPVPEPESEPEVETAAAVVSDSAAENAELRREIAELRAALELARAATVEAVAAAQIAKTK